MPKFKVGDRVRCTRPPVSTDRRWEFLRGAVGIVYLALDSFIHVHWRDHQDNELTSAPGYAWFTGNWDEDYFDLDAPLSPFDAAVRAYIQSELYNAV